MIKPPHGRRTFLTHTMGALTGVALWPSPAAVWPTLQGAPVRIGLIGAGRQGRAILTELQKTPQVEVAAVCDVLGGRVESARARAQSAELFTDHRALLEKRADISAVIVATPTHHHRAIVEDVIAAGRHVFCESPLASTIDDCQALVARATGVKTVCHAGFQGRSNPTYRRAQTLVRTELRDLVSLGGQWHRKTTWRVPATTGELDRAANWRLDAEVSTGLAGEVGAQQFDVAHWLRGRYPVRVTGRGAIRLHKDGRTVPDTIELDLVWDDDVVMRYQATLANSNGGQVEVVHGINTQLAEQGQLQEGAGLPHPPLYYALMDFLKSVAENAPVACSFAEGARASTVGILANQAITTGRAVEIPALA
jgi:predicted dehydrogenase